MSDGTPASTTRLRRWVLLTGDRVRVAAVTLVTGFLLVGVVGYALERTLAGEPAHDATTVSLVGALLSGNFLLFSIVVSVNSLFVTGSDTPLDRELGRVRSVVEFRRQLESVIDADHVPADPARLVRLLSAEILGLAQSIDDDLHAADLDLRADLDAYLSSLAEETGEMNERLDGATSNVDLVVAMMDYNHDSQINDLRGLRSTHADALPAETDESIGDLLRLLQYFATARAYFRSLYVRREFADLSRNLVFTSVVAVATTASFMHFLEVVPTTHFLVVTVEAIALAPFILVGSYVLRVSAVSRRTGAGGGFVRSDRAGGDIDGISPGDGALGDD
ncbi:hypothetical protein I7X12_00290 [Halosimplex litoreum]|uniref:Uncharacterized protein n=1 Tax=Halosimplex litoreum TaxID=1198301 RepID=A0A7T3FYT3_9EURY|nr:hypothetical protein [Halosimplex litoreum]QPV63107.1 hypothetical protein I7X12_00290 [Halosimplex litoreum]